MSTRTWIPLMEYAIKNDISLSTLRRYIKAQKITFRVEHGRYLILQEGSADPAKAEKSSGQETGARAGEARTSDASNANPDEKLRRELQQARRELQLAREEIAELKTLIAFYEERVPPQKSGHGPYKEL